LKAARAIEAIGCSSSSEIRPGCINYVPTVPAGAGYLKTIGIGHPTT
jgi:hypothetical protein